MTNSIGKNITFYREKNNYTMLDVAKFLGCAESTVQRYESGAIKNLKYDTIVALASFLGTTPSIITGWENIEKINTSSSKNFQTPAPTLPQAEENLLTDYRKLNITGKRKAAEYVSDLTDTEKYTVLENEDEAKDAG